MIFLNRLKELRIEKGLLQSDIAKIINKSERTVGFYETGERDMNTETLAKLADFFDVTIDYLLGKSDIKKPDKDTEEFQFAYHSEMNGLTPEEIADALRFYKEMKKRVKGDK